MIIIMLQMLIVLLMQGLYHIGVSKLKVPISLHLLEHQAQLCELHSTFLGHYLIIIDHLEFQ